MDISDSISDRYPEIVSVVRRLEHKYDVSAVVDTDTFDGLTVTVSSFLIRKVIRRIRAEMAVASYLTAVPFIIRGDMMSTSS